MRLVYEKPALRWGEALPLGNGQIGAMVYGGVNCEEIDLTEHTFYSGEVEEAANQEGAAEAFQRMRKAEQMGDYNLVHRKLWDAFAHRKVVCKIWNRRHSAKI